MYPWAKRLLLVLGCGSNEDLGDNTNGDNQTPSKNNVLLIIADDLGLDATVGYNIGNQKPSMPTLQKLHEKIIYLSLFM